MIKIMFNDKKILLCSQEEQSQASVKPCFVFFQWNSSHMDNLLDLLLVSEIKTAVLVGEPDTLLQEFEQRLTVIVAGGGLVINHKQEVLFIFRKGRWDFPKGKQDPGEPIESCALREVREETGLNHLYLGDLLDCTYHIYFENQYVFKKTYWYHMNTDELYLKPQKEEGITKAKWIHQNNIGFQLNNTFDSIRDLCRIYFQA